MARVAMLMGDMGMGIAHWYLLNKQRSTCVGGVSRSKKNKSYSAVRFCERRSLAISNKCLPHTARTPLSVRATAAPHQLAQPLLPGAAGPRRGLSMQPYLRANPGHDEANERVIHLEVDTTGRNTSRRPGQQQGGPPMA